MEPILREMRPKSMKTTRSRARSAPIVAPVLALAMLATASATASGSPAGIGQQPNAAEFTAYTHCGVENIRVDGRWWHAKPPLYNEERTGPPAGWGDPYQKGMLTLESPDRAVFKARGQRVIFVPAPVNAPVRVCL